VYFCNEYLILQKIIINGCQNLFGFEILAKEFKMLGAQNVEQGVRMVSFKGDKGFMYKANLSLRTALKI
jgi:putative N6-adenine-specific DNA methylase